MKTNSPPNWFKAIAIFAILWNGLGIVNFIMQITISAEAIAQLPMNEQALYQNTPVWSHVAFAIGVFGGTLGSFGLLQFKAWSKKAFLASLIAVVCQMGYWLFFTSAVDVYGPSAYGMPIFVILIAILLLQLSNKGIKSGYLN